MHMHSPFARTLSAALALSLAAWAQEKQATHELPRPPLGGQQRRAVTLREALGLADKQGADVAVTRAQAAVAAVGVERAHGAWKPDVLATGTYDYATAEQSFNPGDLIRGVAAALGQTIPPGTALPGPVTIVAHNSLYGTLQISQPLFTPAGVFLIGPAKEGADAAAKGAAEAREQVLLGVARAYLSLKGIEGLLGAARDAERVALRRENDARVQINAGTAVEIALLRAQTDTASSRSQIASLEGQRDSLQALLEGLVSEPITAQPGGAVDPDLGSAAEEGQNPWEQTFAVQSAVSAVRAAAGVVRYDDYQWLPSVAAIGRGNYNSNSGFSGKNFTADFILAASIPLYDRGQRYVARHEDDAKLMQAQANLAASRARARANWAGARANLASAQAVLQQSEAQAALAKRAQEQIEVAAKAGVATSLDLTDADNKRFAAESAAAQSRALVDIRRAEIAAAEGRLAKSVER